MNYDSMSSSELFDRYDKVVLTEPTFPPLMEIRAALRKAAIQEAQVGIIFIEQHEGYMSPDPLFTVETKSKLKAGTFYIVPK